MNKQIRLVSLLSLIAFVLVMGSAKVTNAQERQTFSKEQVEMAKRESEQNKAAASAPMLLGCQGLVNMISDVAYEGVKFTSANYFSMPGGGEGGGFDKTPVLTTRVTLRQGCLNAHVSAIVGGRQTYGVAPMTLFQVSLTRLPGGPIRHMVGHYETPFGMSSPAVALSAEHDVDMYASNFFQKIGTGPHELPPGVYRVDVWWSGAGQGGAIGAGFVLKLYQAR